MNELARPSLAPVIRQLGRAPYLPTWRAMRDFTEQRGADTPD